MYQLTVARKENDIEGTKKQAEWRDERKEKQKDRVSFLFIKNTEDRKQSSRTVDHGTDGNNVTQMTHYTTGSCKHTLKI